MKTEYEKIADLLFPDVTMTVAELLAKYPKRDLKEDQLVTRFAPSPTGYVHIGNLYGAMLDKQLAEQTNGVFYLRIEDTDNKREKEGASDIVYPCLEYFMAKPDEGFVTRVKEVGDYGPYIQSRRKEYYRVFAKDLVSRGLVYPCFCGNDDGEGEDYREEQKRLGVPTGYYGRWAKCRNLTFEQIKANIEDGKNFTIRIKADGDGQRRIILHDLNRGKISVPRNFVDYVLLKSDGQALYHMAHLVDDTLMHTTLVVRDESWIPTWPLHMQLFEYMGLPAPEYLHTAQIMTKDETTGNVRKVSKRYDPWARVDFFKDNGYPAIGIKEYLLNLLNSSFEPWRRANPDAPLSEFKLSTSNLGKSGAMFDMAKLENICKNIIGRMPGEEIYTSTLAWAEEYDKDFAALLKNKKDYAIRVLSMDKNLVRPRKDIKAWSEVKDFYSYMFNELHKEGERKLDFDEKISLKDVVLVLEEYLRGYKHTADNNEWFEYVKQVADKCGFAPETKLYKENPEKYKGSVADVSTIVRVAVTGRRQTPNLCEIMQVLGEDETISRIKEITNVVKMFI